MIEYQVVDVATQYPQACLCGSSKGPFVDTNIMLDARRRWYICRLCVKRAARPLGFMPGKAYDELENAADTLIAKERELAQALARNEKQTGANADLSRRIDELQALIEHYRGLVEQYKHLGGIIFETSRELVATANGAN